MDKEDQFTVPEKETLHEQDDINRQNIKMVQPDNMSDEAQTAEEKHGSEPEPSVHSNYENRASAVELMKSGYGNPIPPMQPNIGNQAQPMQSNMGNQVPPAQPGYGNPIPPMQSNTGNQVPPAQPGYGNPIPPMQSNTGNQVPPMQPGYGNPIPPMQSNTGNQVPPMQPYTGNQVPPMQSYNGNVMQFNNRNQVPPINNGMPSQMMQPPYGYTKRPEEPANGMAIASMVLGIVSIVLCMWFYLALPCAIVGLVLGCVYKYKSGKNGMAVAGIICSSVGIAFAVLEICVYIMSFGAFFYSY